jgi:hypothetical protein
MVSQIDMNSSELCKLLRVEEVSQPLIAGYKPFKYFFP